MKLEIPEAAYDLRADMESRFRAQHPYSEAAFRADLAHLRMRLASMSEAEQAAYWHLVELKQAGYREWREAKMETCPVSKAFFEWMDETQFRFGESIAQACARTGQDLEEIKRRFRVPDEYLDAPMGS